MKQFTWHAPKTTREAVDLLSKHKKSVAVVSGGTDIVIELNERTISPEHVVDLSQVGELKYVKTEKGVMHIGARTTFSELEDLKTVREKIPALYEMASHVGSPQIRNLGTIGGNVSTASVAGDSPTLFETLDAQIVLKSKKGRRVMDFASFNKGPGRSQMKPEELLTEVNFKMPGKDEAVGYFKIGRRKSLAIVVLAVSIYVKKGRDNTVKDARVILGAVSKHPMRAPEIEKALIGCKLTRKELEKTLPLFTEAIDKAIPDRPSVVYKREGVRGAAIRCYDQILDQFGLS